MQIAIVEPIKDAATPESQALHEHLSSMGLSPEFYVPGDCELYAIFPSLKCALLPFFSSILLDEEGHIKITGW